MDPGQEKEHLQRQLSILRERMYQHGLMMEHYVSQVEAIESRARIIGEMDLARKASETARSMVELAHVHRRHILQYGREAKRAPSRSPSLHGLPPLAPIPEIPPRSMSEPALSSIVQPLYPPQRRTVAGRHGSRDDSPSGGRGTV